MGFLKPYQQGDQASPDAAHDTTRVTDFSETPVKTKGGPTPTRAQAEAARRARVKPKLTKQDSKKALRDQDRKRQGQRMREIDARPERVLMRNYVDSRLTLTEFMWPISIVLLIGVIVGGGFREIMWGITIALWALIALAAINIWWFWRGFKLELKERVPSAKYSGLLWAMASRMISLRRIRQPLPAINRGEPY